MDLGGMARLRSQDRLRRAIAAAIVHDDDLEGYAPV